MTVNDQKARRSIKQATASLPKPYLNRISATD